MMTQGDSAREKGECCAMNLKERAAGSHSVSLLICRFQPRGQENKKVSMKSGRRRCETRWEWNGCGGGACKWRAHSTEAGLGVGAKEEKLEIVLQGSGMLGKRRGAARHSKA